MMRRYMPSVLFHTVLFLNLAMTFAQAQQPAEHLGSYMSEIRAGKYVVVPKELLMPKNLATVVLALELYEKDTIAVVRAGAYAVWKQLGMTTREPDDRQRAVSRLVQACKDNDGGNSGKAMEYLTGFSRKDFTPAAQDSVRSLFRQKTAHFDNLLKLIGYLELSNLIEEIRTYAGLGNSKNIRWAALLCLARMNDAAGAADMMQRLRKLNVSNDAVYDLFPDLVYTRYPEAIAYMVEAMNNDEKNCLTADAEREVAIPCGYRIMEQLAPIIDKYPVELDESGDIKSKDYAATLQKVREWFAKNKNYKILRDRY